METSQTDIMAANSTVIMTRQADPYASWQRTQKEDGRPKASRMGTENRRAKTGHTRAHEDTPRVSMDTKMDATTTRTAASMGTEAVTITTTADTRDDAGL